jgi:hypothetical protein
MPGTSDQTFLETLREITRRLHALLPLASGTAVISAGAFGCSDDEQHGGQRDGEAVAVACNAQLQPFLSEPIQATRPIDYVSIDRMVSSPFSPSPSHPYAVLEYGAPCGGAADLAGCMTALATLRDAETCATPPCSSAIVGTQGVFQQLDREALVLALGEIDGVTEALLVAGFDGQAVVCSERDPVLTGTAVRPTADGFELQTEYDECGAGVFRDRVLVGRTGSVARASHVQVRTSNCAIGRRPAGLSDVCAADGRDAGSFLARAAELEAASVYAFRQLLHELTALDAPEALRAAARAALADELMHAAATAALARRYGATVRAPVVCATPLRTKLAIARENAEEGCVRETYGALVAAHQAAHAQDPEVRTTLARIARDELRHAALGWAVAAWLEPQLSGAERRQLDAARSRALQTLRDEIDVGLSDAAARLLGHPGAADALRMLDGLEDKLRSWTIPERAAA